MLRILDEHENRRERDLSRRDWLRIGGIGLGGLSLPTLAAAAPDASNTASSGSGLAFGRARLDLHGSAQVVGGGLLNVTAGNVGWEGTVAPSGYVTVTFNALLNAPYGADKIWDELPREVQEQIIEKKLRFYVIDGTRIAGPGYSASLNRGGRKFSAGFGYSDFSPGFETLPGFVPRKDVRNFSGEVSYRWWPERRLHSWGPNFIVERVWDHSGTRLNWIAVAELNFTFAAQSSFTLMYAPENELFRPQDFPILTSNLDLHRTTRGFSFSTSLLKQATLSGEFNFGQRVHIDPPAGQPPPWPPRRRRGSGAGRGPSRSRGRRRFR